MLIFRSKLFLADGINVLSSYIKDMSSPAVDDTVDEVKVFRSNDVDEVLDTAQSSQQLSEDKKDVAYETEMDAPTSNISKNLI
jgi:hypothetical protein